MVVFHVSTFILQLHFAGGYDFAGSFTLNDYKVLRAVNSNLCRTDFAPDSPAAPL